MRHFWKFTLFFIFILTSKSSIFGQGVRDELMALYNSTGGPVTWLNRDGWGTTDTICEWYGVHCFMGEVVSINISDNGLTGELVDIKIPSLEVLSLSRNQIAGNLIDFSNLPSLENLELSHNLFEGIIPNYTAIPNLLNLYLDSNLLSGLIPNFTNLPNLNHLHLSHNNLSGTIPDFSNLSNIYTLALFNNSLSGSIPNFKNINTVTNLALWSNNLSGDIPNFDSLNNLYNLSISGNNLTGQIPNFSNLPELRTINLENNLLKGEIPDFNTSPYIYRISLYNNNLTGEIPNFDNIINLRELWINNNKLNGCYPTNVCDYESFRSQNNPLLPWQGDHTNFCNGIPETGASCYDGNPNTSNDLIGPDCSCGNYFPCDNPTFDVEGYVCQFESFLFREESYSPGSYSIVFSSLEGCDTTYYLNVLSFPTTYGPDQQTYKCKEEQSLTINGQPYESSASPYLFTFVNSRGCDSLVNFYVDDIEVSGTIQATPSSLPCAGAATGTLSLIPNWTYPFTSNGIKWYNSSDVNIGIGNSVQINNPGIYYAVVTTLMFNDNPIVEPFNFSCTDTFSIIVPASNSSLAAPMTSGPSVLCAGDQYTYSVTNLQPGTTSYSWEYTGSNVTGNNDGPNLNLSYATPGNYEICVNAIDGCGPGPQSCIAIQVVPSPKIIMHNSNIFTCSLKSELKADITDVPDLNDPKLNYSWEVLSGPELNEVIFEPNNLPFTNVTVKEEGLYIFQLTTDYENLNCGDAQKVEVLFEENVMVNISDEICNSEKYTFKGNLYTIGNHKISVTGVGCDTIYNLDIKEKKCEGDLILSNIITPNNDGINDELRFNNDKMIGDSELSIYNRWGSRIYHKKDYSNDWNGDNLPGGSYFYIFKIGDKVYNKNLTVIK